MTPQLDKIEIFYSDEDKGYICLIPKYKGLSAFGETPEEALKEGLIAYEGFNATEIEGKED